MSKYDTKVTRLQNELNKLQVQLDRTKLKALFVAIMQTLKKESRTTTTPTFYVMPCNDDITEWMMCNYDDDNDLKYDGHVVEWSEGRLIRNIRIGGSLRAEPNIVVQIYPNNVLPATLLNFDHMDLKNIGRNLDEHADLHPGDYERYVRDCMIFCNVGGFEKCKQAKTEQQ